MYPSKPVTKTSIWKTVYSSWDAAFQVFLQLGIAGSIPTRDAEAMKEHSLLIAWYDAAKWILTTGHIIPCTECAESNFYFMKR